MSPSPAFNARLFLTGTLSFIVLGMASTIFGVALPTYTDAFGLTDRDASLLLSLYAFGAMITVAIGIFAARLPTLRRGLFLMAAGSALLAWGANWPLLLAGGAMAGLGFGCLGIVVNRQFLAGFGPRGPGMVGIVNAVAGLGAIISPLLFVWAGGSPAWVFAGIGLLALAIIPLVEPDTSVDGEAAGLPHLWQPRLLVVGFIIFSAMIEAGLVGLGPTALIAGGIDRDGAARLSSGFSLMLLLGRVALYWQTRYVRADMLYLVSLLGSAGCAAIAAAGWPSVGFVLAGWFAGMFFPTSYVWVIGLLGDSRIGSVILCAGLGAVALCPLILSYVLQQTGADALFAILSGVGFVVSVAFVPVMIWARGAMVGATPSGHDLTRPLPAD